MIAARVPDRARHDARPNFDANVGAAFKDPAFDPGNRYTMAWQSGMTGIAYNTKFVDEEITSLEQTCSTRSTPATSGCSTTPPTRRPWP